MAAARLPATQTVVRLMRRPVGNVVPGKDLVVDRTTAVLSKPLGDGELLVRNLWMSLDPAMRGWMNDRKSYIPPVGLGDIMRAGCVSEVVQSNSPKFKPGQLVTGMFGMCEYAVTGIKGVDAVTLPAGLTPAVALGVMGMTGLTAYFGLLDIGKPVAGETVVVSSAAGATGSVVTQIAKHVIGCRVVGIAGGPEKCQWVKSELGADECIDYKTLSEKDFRAALAAATPKGIDVYFDNVGGSILDNVLARINRSARVVICGGIANYNADTVVPGPTNFYSILVNRARVEGFIVFDYAARYREAQTKIAEWIMAGKLKHKEHIVDGLDKAPETLLALFNGENFGKLLIKIAEPSQPVSRL